MSKKKVGQIRALDVALYFIHRSNKAREPITNKKLQKLVYYAQVWSLVINEEKLYSERIEAWVHGPAIPALYRKFKRFEFRPIEFDASEVQFSFSEKQTRLLDNVWQVYGKYPPSYLEALTHSELPWQEARADLASAEPSQKSISLKTAKDYYAGKLRENK